MTINPSSIYINGNGTVSFFDVNGILLTNLQNLNGCKVIGANIVMSGDDISVTFSVNLLQSISGATFNLTYTALSQQFYNSISYATKLNQVYKDIVQYALVNKNGGATIIGGVVAEYPNYASFPATGQSGVIYIDMSVPEAYVWDGAAYQSLSGGAGGFVPYTGATADVDLGAYNLKADALEVSQTPVDTAGVGKMVWNDTDGTIEFKLKGGNVTLQTGQEEVVRVVNKAGVNLLEAAYQVVRIRLVSEGGASGQRLAVVLAQANNDTNSATTIGVVTENINDNQEGFITTSGTVREINTTGTLQGETWVDGDIIYLSPTVPGQLTNIKPTAPDHTIIVGFVEYAHAIHGKIFVKVDNGYELDELHNVAITSPVTNDILQYNSSGLWVNNNPPLLNFITVSDGTGVTATTVSTLTNSILIPANSVSTGDMIYIKTRVRKTGTLGTLVVRMYVNTTATIGGSLIATSAANAATTLYFQYARTLAVKTSTNTESMAGNANVNADDNIGLTVAVSTSNIDWTVDQYLIVAVQNGNIGDTTRSSFIHVQVHKS
jgi:hypothetical protein